MIHLPRSLRQNLPVIALLSCGLLAGTLQAQTAETAPAAPEKAAQTVKLDPFEVSATSDSGYGAINSNSVTAFNTELSKLPVSADVFDTKLMKDSGLQTVEQMMQFFSAGSGSASSAPDVSAANSQYLDRNANGALSLRGLAAPTTMLNGFFPAGGNGITGTGISSTFDIEKVEVINGPQALLYGVSGAGGVVNLTTKQARLGAPTLAALEFQFDQYGHKLGQLDYGMGNDRFAVRLALLDQTIGGRRVFVGGPLQGAYVQAAVKVMANTTVRLTWEDTGFQRSNATSGTMTYTALSTANDARNGQNLHWLLATNQVNAAANGAPSGGGPIMGGNLNWDNIDSLSGIYAGEYDGRHLYTLQADTRWSDWFSTQLSVGYRRETNMKFGNGAGGTGPIAPNVVLNPYGTTAMAMANGIASELWLPNRQKVARFSGLLDNQLFSGKVHSQTIFGADTTRTDAAVNSYYYVQADQDFNPVLGTSKYNNLILLPTVYWPLNNGPTFQPYWNPYNAKITYNGTNYVRALTNATVPSLVSPGNPEGLSGNGTGDLRHSTDLQSGIYAANYSDLFGGALTTLAGVRVGKAYSRFASEISGRTSSLQEVNSKFTAYNAGVNAKVVGNLRAYAEVSDDFQPAGTRQFDPYGKTQQASNGLGEEVGLKHSIPEWNASESLAFYHTRSKNEQLSFTSTISTDINPAGLNGTYSTPGQLINVDRDTRGAQLAFTAAPGHGWRFRLSGALVDAKIQSNSSYAQLYNDQFYQTASGQVTYADGSPVYVPPTYNSKAPVATATTPGAVPLTLSMMNNPTSVYYANPNPVTSAIPTTSAVATVLLTKDPVHGSILTGKTGLPISSLQITPNAISPPPGVIVVTKPGDVVTGFPQMSMNFIGLRTFQSGWPKGLSIGSAVSVAWKTSLYYYYPQTAANPDFRSMFYYPTETVVTGILGYGRKLKRVTWSAQLNVNNLFNHYHVLLLPSYVNGWKGPNNASFDQQPRNFLVTTTVEY